MKSWFEIFKVAVLCLLARLRVINPIVPYPASEYLKRADEHVWNKLSSLHVADVEQMIHNWLLQQKTYGVKLSTLLSYFDPTSKDVAIIPSIRGALRACARRQMLEVLLCPDGLFIALFIVYEDGADKPARRRRAYLASGRQRYKFRFIEEDNLETTGDLHFRTLRSTDRDFSLDDRDVIIACHFKPEELPEAIRALLPTTKQRIAK